MSSFKTNEKYIDMKNVWFSNILIFPMIMRTIINMLLKLISIIHLDKKVKKIIDILEKHIKMIMN